MASVGNSEHGENGALGDDGHLQFYSGNHFVEVTKGSIRLFKGRKKKGRESPEVSDLICILSVPTSMTTHDLIQFTAPLKDGIENMRIVRDNKPNQYMVLIKFRNQGFADDFYNNYNGVAFNSIEPELCRLVFVAEVELPGVDATKRNEPIAGLTELPTCPVCLERLDESIEGILTILCNHSFHGNCLDKWGDTSCPVCRYTQTPPPVASNRCFECPEDCERSGEESLWICLVCGHIGCGRYLDGHAYKHYLDTQHTYSMQLGSNRVWDYAGDNYVHRLLQNKADGKVVEVECNPSNQHVSDEKIEAVQLECTYLLTNQLETQRRYFEERIGKIENDSREQIKELIDKARVSQEGKEKLEEKYNNLSKEKQTVDKKVSTLTQRLNKISAELEEERQMNKCLRENQNSWQTKLNEVQESTKKLIEKKDEEIDELKDQVRDLMFFLETQNKLKDVTEEERKDIESGTIVVGESPSSASSSGSKGRRRRK